MILTGEYVYLRPLAVPDAEMTQRWRTGGRAKLLNRGARNVDEQRDWIVKRPETEMNFVICLNAQIPVGMLSLIDIDKVHRHAETAHFLIGEEEAVRGTPAAYEAMRLIYGLAFDRLSLHRIWGQVASDNKMMITWQRMFGMKEEGRLRDHYFLDGHWQDAVLMGLTEDDYREVALPKLTAFIEAAR
jgi:RimJ/RimL family protein N-acetyltransferase